MNDFTDIIASDLEAWGEALHADSRLVEVRIVGPGDHRSREWCSPLELVSTAERLHRPGGHIYIGAHERTKRAGTADAVGLARAVFTDIDGIGPHDGLRRIDAAGLPTPTVAVASGGGLHAWWRLEAPLDLADARDRGVYIGTMRAIAAAVGGDAVHDPPRVMRPAGVPNPKRSATARLLYEPLEDWWSIDEIGVEADFASDPAIPPVPSPGPTSDPLPIARLASPATLRFLVEGAGEGGRNRAAFAAAADLAGLRQPFELVERLVLDGASRCRPPMDAHEARIAVRSAFGGVRVSSPAFRAATEVGDALARLVGDAKPAATRDAIVHATKLAIRDLGSVDRIDAADLAASILRHWRRADDPAELGHLDDAIRRVGACVDPVARAVRIAGLAAVAAILEPVGAAEAVEVSP